MVFEYKPGRRVKAPELPQPPTWTHDDHDPFPAVEAWHDRSVAERVSWLEEMARWTQHYIHACAEIAAKHDALKAKLEDPKLADNPHRLKAVHRAETLWDDMVQAARDAVWTIAEADRAWQSLTWKQRDPVSGHWHTPSEEDSLVGLAWTGLASFETWPRHFRLSRLWFNDMPEPLIRDLHDSSIWTWTGSSGADPPDPFGGETVIDTALARELHERT